MIPDFSITDNNNFTNQAIEIIQAYPAEFVVIAGPTCSGKTAIALDLAQHFRVPIINADSRLIFQEMNIGTAKPSFTELSRVKHFLVDIKKPNETYSAAEFQQDFDLTAVALFSQPSVPKAIVVGGTGLYIKSALENLLIPKLSQDPQLRKVLSEQTLEELLNQLNKIDSSAGDLIDKKNKIRVIRAIEIITLTGQKLSEARLISPNPRYNAIYIGLNFKDRGHLYSLIDARVLDMIDQGLILEVQTLLDKYGPSQTLKATIGYKEVLEHLYGKLSLDETIRLIQKNSRNYAKRQITWFKANQKINWIYK
jgi:tRNA dimethylallyltransferase